MTDLITRLVLFHHDLADHWDRLADAYTTYAREHQVWKDAQADIQALRQQAAACRAKRVER